ncbi:hypothetical protein T492DRAFT_59573 [Pavlovales sp. CCMP2436]|nr:hypothetical protein T492DRAFT_59573 [Pavlovales sp. CCMP2436]
MASTRSSTRNSPPPSCTRAQWRWAAARAAVAAVTPSAPSAPPLPPKRRGPEAHAGVPRLAGAGLQPAKPSSRKDWSRARSRYECAARLAPAHGVAYNQLAVLEAYAATYPSVASAAHGLVSVPNGSGVTARGVTPTPPRARLAPARTDTLRAAWLYARALACDIPFATAATNLQQLLARRPGQALSAPARGGPRGGRGAGALARGGAGAASEGAGAVAEEWQGAFLHAFARVHGLCVQAAAEAAAGAAARGDVAPNPNRAPSSAARGGGGEGREGGWKGGGAGGLASTAAEQQRPPSLRILFVQSATLLKAHAAEPAEGRGAKPRTHPDAAAHANATGANAVAAAAAAAAGATAAGGGGGAVDGVRAAEAAVVVGAGAKAGPAARAHPSPPPPLQLASVRRALFCCAFAVWAAEGGCALLLDRAAAEALRNRLHPPRPAPSPDPATSRSPNAAAAGGVGLQRAGLQGAEPRSPGLATPAPRESSAKVGGDSLTPLTDSLVAQACAAAARQNGRLRSSGLHAPSRHLRPGCSARAY